MSIPDVTWADGAADVVDELGAACAEALLDVVDDEADVLLGPADDGPGDWFFKAEHPDAQTTTAAETATNAKNDSLDFACMSTNSDLFCW